MIMHELYQIKISKMHYLKRIVLLMIMYQMARRYVLCFLIVDS